MIGGTIPGIPLVLSGRSGRLGWGMTSSYMDDRTSISSSSTPTTLEPNTARRTGSPLRTRAVDHPHQGCDPVTLTLRWTENGPVLPGSHFDLAEVTPPGHVASLAWTALGREDTTMTAAIGLMRAQSIAAMAAGQASSSRRRRT